MTDPYISAAVTDFEKTLVHLKEEFGKLQVGRANPSLLEGVMVESYGSKQPLKNVANISVPESTVLQVQPWDKGTLANVEKAIQQADLNLNPINNGSVIIVNIPPLTEERRRELVKIVNRLAEEARISIRNARQAAHSKFKQLAQDKDITEDDAKAAEKRLQEKVDESNDKVAEMSKAKEESVMKV